MKIIHIVAILIGIIVILKFVPIKVWIAARIAGVKVSLASLIGMKLRKTSVKSVVKAYVKAKKAGVNVTLKQLESHHQAGGDVGIVVDVLVKAERVKMDLSFNWVATADLSDGDLLEELNSKIKG